MNVADYISFILFWIIIILALISAIPVNLKKRFYSYSLYYPFIALLVYLPYEKMVSIAMPIDNVPIRVDLLFIWPALLFILLSSFVRWGICIYKNKPEKNIDEKKIQFRAIIPLFAILSVIWCLIVFG